MQAKISHCPFNRSGLNHKDSRSAPLTDRLREQTEPLHASLEQLPFSQLLFSGDLPRSVYLQYLLGLRLVYQSLEAEIKSWSQVYDKTLEAFYPVFRSQLIDEDIQVLSGGSSTQSLVNLPKDLIESIHGSLERTLALAYVRFLGDLGGGQLLARQLRTRWQLPLGHSNGLAMYAYHEQVPELRKKVKSVINGLSLSVVQQELILKAAESMFKLHRQWFLQLMPQNVVIQSFLSGVIHEPQKTQHSRG